MVSVLLIFLAKIVEVTLSTLRVVYVNKGEKVFASAIGFVEVMIWLKVASVVIVGINDEPYKMFAYALGFAAGSYVGIKIEEKIGLGYTRLEIITTLDEGNALAEQIRLLGKAVTLSEAHGKNGNNVVLTTFLKRKTKEIVLEKCKEMEISGVITVSEIQKVYGGFGLK